MSKSVTKDRIGRVYMVRCPNKHCSHVFTVPHQKIDNRKNCPKCSSRFLPRNQIVSK